MDKEKKNSLKNKIVVGAGFIVSAVAAGALGYKLGVDKVYTTFVPGSYRVDGLKRYIGPVKELDISAFGVKIVNSPFYK